MSRLTLLALPGICILLYLPSALTNGFVEYDDRTFIYDEPRVLEGLTWSNVGWAMTSLDEINYIPVTRLSWLLESTLFGGPNAVATHLISLLLHAFSSVWLYLVVRRLARVFRYSAGSPEALAGAVSLLWAVHPLTAEVVCWATSRKHVLAAFFGFASTAFYLKGLADGVNRRRSILLSFVLLLFSLGSKPVFALLPVFFLAVESFLGKKQRGTWVALSLMLAAGLAFSLASKQAYAVSGESVMLPTQVEALRAAPVDLVRMTGRVFFPFNLSFHYPFDRSTPLLQSVAAYGLIFFVVFLIAWCRKDRPLVSLGLLWSILLVLPAAGFVPVGYQGGADRFVYAAFPGLFLALLSCLDLRAAVSKVAIGSLAALLAVLTAHQSFAWRDSETLYRCAIRAAPGSPVPHFQLALLYGRDEEQAAKGWQALRTAAYLDSRFAPARHNLAVAAMQQGRPDLALAHAEAAVAASPQWAEAHLVLANASYETGKKEQALRHYRIAARLKPSLPTAAANAKSLTNELEGDAESP